MVRRFIQPLSGLGITGSCVPQVSPVAIRIESLRDSSLPKQHYLRLFVLIYSGFLAAKTALLVAICVDLFRILRYQKSLAILQFFNPERIEFE